MAQQLTQWIRSGTYGPCMHKAGHDTTHSPGTRPGPGGGSPVLGGGAGSKPATLSTPGVEESAAVPFPALGPAKAGVTAAAPDRRDTAETGRPGTPGEVKRRQRASEPQLASPPVATTGRTRLHPSASNQRPGTSKGCASADRHP